MPNALLFGLFSNVTIEQLNQYRYRPVFLIIVSQIERQQCPAKVIVEYFLNKTVSAIVKEQTGMITPIYSLTVLLPTVKYHIYHEYYGGSWEYIKENYLLFTSQHL